MADWRRRGEERKTNEFAWTGERAGEVWLGEMDGGRGKDGKKPLGHETKGQSPILISINAHLHSISATVACHMRTCNDISRRWDGGLWGTLSWAHKIGRRGR